MVLVCKTCGERYNPGPHPNPKIIGWVCGKCLSSFLKLPQREIDIIDQRFAKRYGTKEAAAGGENKAK